MTQGEAIHRATEWLMERGTNPETLRWAGFLWEMHGERWYPNFCHFAWRQEQERKRRERVEETYRLINEWLVVFHPHGVEEPQGPQELIRVIVDDASGNVRPYIG